MDIEVSGAFIKVKQMTLEKENNELRTLAREVIGEFETGVWIDGEYRMCQVCLEKTHRTHSGLLHTPGCALKRLKEMVK